MLSERLKALRARTGKSQQEVATTAGLSWSMVAQLEQGRRPDLKMSTIVSLAHALGIEPAGLFDILLAEGVGGEVARFEEDKTRRPAGQRGRPRGGREGGRSGKG